MKLYTHLNLGGNCREAFEFYERHLDGRIMAMIPQAQLPGGGNGAGEAIAHAQMEIGSTRLIGNDVPSERFERMRSVYLYLAAESTEEAERAHALLADGGEVYMPLEETFFATRFSMLRDRFGVSWTIIHERPQ